MIQNPHHRKIASYGVDLSKIKTALTSYSNSKRESQEKAGPKAIKMSNEYLRNLLKSKYNKNPIKAIYFNNQRSSLTRKNSLKSMLNNAKPPASKGSIDFNAGNKTEEERANLIRHINQCNYINRYQHAQFNSTYYPTIL